jgi:polysaccharide export outer membrane protein
MNPKLGLIVVFIYWQLILPVAAEQYLIGVGDTIKISVYGEPDLTTQAKIGKSGQISFPFLKNLSVAGLTVEQIEQTIDSGLRGDYLIEPQIDVTIITYRPFFIHGEVKKPGGYPYQIDISLDKAIALAGGLTDRASGENWTIQRKIDGKLIELQAQLITAVEPDDIIKIEKSFF